MATKSFNITVGGKNFDAEVSSLDGVTFNMIINGNPYVSTAIDTTPEPEPDPDPEEPDEPDTPEPEPTPEPTPDPEGVILASFDSAPSINMFTVGSTSAYGDGKITYNETYYKKGVKLDSKGSITFTPQKNYNMTIIMGTAKSGRDVKLNDVKTTVSGTENTTGKYYELEPIAITAGTKYVITKGSAEGLVMLIKLEPVSQE
jgi:hypothetical protein